MTKKELEQLSSLEQEIKILDQIIEQETAENTEFDVVSGSSPDFPFVQHPISVRGLPDDKAAEMLKGKNLNRLLSLKIRRDAEKAKLLAFVDTVEDSLVRQIIMAKYYSKCKVSWRDVSMMVYGRYDKGDFARIAVNRYLSKS